MHKQAKDRLYDSVLCEPTRENFLSFLKDNFGEMDEIDFKENWIDKGSLAKIMLSMGNSRGGVIVVGIHEEQNGTLTLKGLEELKDKAVINNDIAKYIPPELDYEVFDFCYDSFAAPEVANLKFQMLVVHDTPDRLPFFASNATTGLEKDMIYVRRGTKCEKATASEIEQIMEDKIETIFKATSDLTLDKHLAQLRMLYEEIPQKIKVLIRRGDSRILEGLSTVIRNFSSVFYETPDEYEEKDNPNYPEESYEAFIVRMIKLKKLKIEKVLDLK